MVAKIDKELLGPPGQHDGTPLGKAIQRRLGLDDPGGKTAFLAQFKSSYPADISQRTESLLPSLREELISKIAGQM